MPALAARRWTCSSQAKGAGIFGGDLEKLLGSVTNNGRGPSKPLEKFNVEGILNAQVPELKSPLASFVHEGLWIFGGKSKRGKSWLMLDMALAVSSGTLAFGALPSEKMKVLYICLEDGLRRVKSRMAQFDIDEDLNYELDVVFEFPSLDNGGSEELYRAMDEYGLVIVDVATKILPRTSSRGNVYEETYDILTPLHDKANAAHCTLILIDHLRKSTAEDIFDEIMGSVAKQGVADGLMVMERAPRENELLIHMRGKEFGEKIHALYFNGVNFQYRGEGDSFALKAEQQRIIDILLEEQGDFIGITDIMRALGVDGNAHYKRVRRSLIVLLEDGFIGSMQQKGRKVFGANMKSKYERLTGEHAEITSDDMPF